MAWSGRALKEARERRGLTQEALAKRLRVNRVTVARLEIDTRRPSLPLLERIANALGVEVTDLLDRRRA